MKNRVAYLGLLLCLSQLFTTSCTVLQWRQNDAEILEKFKSNNIPTEISYFEVDSLDLKIRVQQVRQSESDVNLVFLHGSPSSIATWNRYLLDSTMIEKANLFAVDRPGYGYSNFGDEMPSIVLQAEIISQLINTYQLQNVIAIGASYGGPLVSRMAVLNEKVKAVVMISPAIDPTQEKDIWASRFTQWWLTRWLVPTAYRVAGDEKTVHAQELAKLENDWNKVSVPVLHFHGTIDNVVPFENINYTKAKFKNNTVITIPDKGHEISYAHPELIIPHLLKLIEILEK